MHGYTPGLQPEPPVIKLNTNENPYPPSPPVAETLSALSVDMLQRYSDPLASAFRMLPQNVIATTAATNCSGWPTTFLDSGKPPSGF
jgi:histidinol-phosphate aminotransferase